jgi:predicted nuclease of predicted toxin-antitoxin system
MKLWIDAQLSPALANWITENFANIEATAVREANATVMTKDSDFPELQRRHGAPPKIIWVTCGNTSNVKLKEVLSVHLQRACELLEQGESLVEITG